MSTPATVDSKSLGKYMKEGDLHLGGLRYVEGLPVRAIKTRGFGRGIFGGRVAVMELKDGIGGECVVRVEAENPRYLSAVVRALNAYEAQWGTRIPVVF